MSRRLLERTRFPSSRQHSGLGTDAARRLEETKDIDVGEVWSRRGVVWGGSKVIRGGDSVGWETVGSSKSGAQT